MKRLGEVARVAQGLLVARSPDDERPGVGTEAVTQDLATAGRVVDVFGPVDRPYLAVTPADEVRPATLIGEPLYAR